MHYLFYTETGTYVLLGIILLLAYLFSLPEIKRGKAELSGIFDRMAVNYNGRVEETSGATQPALAVPCDGTEARIFIKEETTSKGRRFYYTNFNAKMPLPEGFRVRIYRELRFMGIGTVFGQDIRTGDPDFDREFVIQSSDEPRTRALLTDDIRMNYLRLLKYKPLLTIKDGLFSISFTGILRDEQAYDMMITTGLAMLRRLQETS